MKFPCTLKNALLIIRDHFGLSFASKGLGYLAALLLLLSLLARYKLSCYQTTRLLTISAHSNNFSLPISTYQEHFTPRKWRQKRALMTHKYRGSIVVLSISKSVEPTEEQKEMTSGFQQGILCKH